MKKIAALFFALCALVVPVSAQALIDAINNGDVAAARRLISAGADVNAPDSLGLAPLMVAQVLGIMKFAKC